MTRPAAVLALALVACGGATTAEPTAPAARVASTGAVSEDEFMRLHQLREDEAPALRGEAIELAGSTAYLSLPEGTPRGGILVIHEWWGLNDHIRHWADRLAAEGYAALAVDLYGGEVATTPEDAMRLMQAVDEAAGLAVVRAGVAFLAEDPRVHASRRAVIGWCFGGAWSLETALRVEGIDAAVMYYGRVVDDPERLRAFQGPLLGVFGDRDTSIPPERVDAFDAALTEAGVTHEILRFDAEHAFANPSSARYDHESAAAAWERVRGFLAEHLGR